MHTVLWGKRIKPHICETTQILTSVKQDLSSRGSDKFQEIRTDSIAIDFGGAILASTPWHQVPETTVEFLNQHYSLLRRAIGKSTLREGYWKIHAERAICLSPQTYELVVRYLVENEQELLQLEAGVFEAFIDARMTLQGHPNIDLSR